MTNPPNIKAIGCRELYEASLGRAVELIDVRSPEEYREIHAANARNVPLDTLDPAALVHSRTSPTDEPLYFICAVGVRSGWACEMMAAAGCANVVNVAGGTQAWIAAGLPVQQGA